MLSIKKAKMRQELKNHITAFLDSFSNFFHSEEEVQLLLAQYLMNTDSYKKVLVEYYIKKHLIPNYPWDNDKKISIDIVVVKDNKFIPIEIKYKTKQQELPHFVFGSQTNVELKNQGAQNEGCYSFWKDLKRIEILKETFDLPYYGLTLFISNDPSYERKPREGVQYGPFSIHQNREVHAGTFLNWDESITKIKPDRGKRFPGFKITNSYAINWKDLKIKKHKYILL